MGQVMSDAVFKLTVQPIRRQIVEGQTRKDFPNEGRTADLARSHPVLCLVRPRLAWFFCCFCVVAWAVLKRV